MSFEVLCLPYNHYDVARPIKLNRGENLTQYLGLTESVSNKETKTWRENPHTWIG